MTVRTVILEIRASDAVTICRRMGASQTAGVERTVDSMADKELIGNSEQLDCSDCVNHGGDWDCDHVQCHKGADTISRAAALDALAEWHDEAITNRLNNLPSAQQWIPCSECKKRCEKWEQKGR